MSPNTARQEGVSIRQVRHQNDLRVFGGSASARVSDRNEWNHLATLPHRRLSEAAAEAIASCLAEGAESQIVEMVNGEIVVPAALSRRETAVLRKSRVQLKAAVVEKEDFLQQSKLEEVRAGLESSIAKDQVEVRRLDDQLKRAKKAHRKVEPFQQSDVTALLTVLGDIVNAKDVPGALEGLLPGLRLTKVTDLTLTYETSVFVPAEDGKRAAILGPTLFTVENTRRIPGLVRLNAMADLCLANSWPAKTVAGGIPYICASLQGHRVASAISRKLKPLIGTKAASVAAGCEAPEVLAVLARHLELGTPEVQVAPDLRERILDTYVEGPPPGPKGWKQENDSSTIANLVRDIHENGSIPIDTVQGGAAAYKTWVDRQYVTEQGSQLVRPMCQCGSCDLALIAAPEPQGLVCLKCREDRSGLVIPTSWNPAACHVDYWAGLGYSLTSPPIPGLLPRHLPVRAISLR